MCERTVAEYEEELSPTKEENGRQHQLLDADFPKHKVVLHRKDVRQPPLIKEEEEEMWTTQDGECLLGQEEADLTKFPLTAVSVKTEEHEDKPPESSQLHHSPDSQQRLGRQEACAPQPLEGSSTWKQEDPHSPQIKEEEEELWITQEGECLLGQEEEDLTKFPLTVVTVKIEDHEEKPPESSQLHHSPDVRHLPSDPQGWGSRVEEEQPQPPHIKDEDEDRSISQDAGHFEGLEEFPVIVVIVKSEGNEFKGESEEKREAEPPSSSSTQHMTTEAGGSQADNLIAPLSESDDTSHFTDTDDEDFKDKTCHTDNTHFKCSHCDNTFVTETNLNKHMRYHAEKTLECSVCSKRFLWKSHLIAHARIHSGEKPFACSVCGKGFVASHCLQTHMRTHTGDKPFMCSVCGKTFSQTAHLNVHLRKHTMEKPFPCSVCGKGFVRREYLKIHMRIHTGEKPFTCSICGMDFIRDSYLKKHMTSHTGEKPFLCSVCGKRFSDKVRLTAHAKIHTVEKPFSCSVCGIGFVQNQYLKVHMRLHTGDKPHTCSVCGVSYTRSQYLKRHMRKHTGEKVYRCSVCDERFFYQYQLNKHTCAGENNK
ncbi:uncharacterized protein [Nerophis lumbriciformis]|uniref:uncharacterized protein isoform X3 n=1 Tax=Nerophis lumbriciformis TaxID=546530 RepID=UPI003BABB4CE